MTHESLTAIDVFLPDVEQYIQRFLPSDWPEASARLGSVMTAPGPLELLPLASSAAVGGSPGEAVPLAAAWKAYGLAMRLLDDLQDQDRPGRLWDQVGPARAFNFGALLYAMCQEMLAAAEWPAERHRQIALLLGQAGQRLLHGQDLDLQGSALDLDDYWQMIEEKNGTAFAFICQAGALCGSQDEEDIGRCREYGHHLGMALQLFDDYQGFWAPEGTGDLAMNKVTMPVLVALEHPANRNGPLAALVAQRNLAENATLVRVFVDQSDARTFMLLSAAGARDRALAALEGLPGNDGSKVLRDYVQALFVGLDGEAD